MALANQNEQGRVTSESEASDLSCLCRTGGVAAFVLVAYSLFTMVQLTVLGGPPATAAEAFRLLQSNRIVGLLRLDLPTIVAMPLYYFVFLGIYAALRRTDRANVILSTALAFVGVTLLLATPTALSMMSLSQKYASATTEATRSQFLAAGEAVLATDIWHGTGAIMGGIVLQSGAVLISVVMLRSSVFSRTTAYLGHSDAWDLTWPALCSGFSCRSSRGCADGDRRPFVSGLVLSGRSKASKAERRKAQVSEVDGTSLSHTLRESLGSVAKQNRRPKPPVPLKSVLVVRDRRGASASDGRRLSWCRRSCRWCSTVRRRLGLLASFSSSSLCLFSIAASRAFTSSNSDVVTTYCCLAGRILRISSCDFSMRSGVCGWCRTPWTSVPGLLLLHGLNLFEEGDERRRIVARPVHVLDAEIVGFRLESAREVQEGQRNAEAHAFVDAVSAARRP